MPKFHHANLGVLPDQEDAEAAFLVEILGYRRIQPPPIALGFGALWFEADDGTQVHLSLDPEHRPAARAHTAIDISGQCEAIEGKLAAAGMEFTAGDFNDHRIVNCEDPAGNKWELRG